MNVTTTMLPEDELWESIGGDKNGSQFENLKDDAELLFDNQNHGGVSSFCFFCNAIHIDTCLL